METLAILIKQSSELKKQLKEEKKGSDKYNILYSELEQISIQLDALW